jgi:hypothetical protein
MKKTILYLITSLVILSSCEKEDDILRPIPSNPTQTTDTLVVNGDTIVNNVDTVILNSDTTTTYTPTGGVTIVSDPDNFNAYGNGVYKLTNCEFVMTRLSNSPETHLDTSYTYSYNETECNSYAVFGTATVFESFVVPVNTGTNPNHTSITTTYPQPESRILFESTNCVYANGVLTMDLEFTICFSSGPRYCTTSVEVVQYSDGSFDLVLDIPQTLCSPIAGNQFTPFTWKSYTKLHFEKQ